jgi:RHS repeat-associated protein
MQVIRKTANILGGFAWIVAAACQVNGGNIVLTGHDDDFHRGSAALAQATGMLRFARAGAPNPSKPVLAFDHGTELQSLLTALGVPFVRVDPDVGVPSASLFDVAQFSAIVVASDQSCGGCDNDATSSANIAGAASAIATFFASGGGIVAFAGAHNTSYYQFVPASASGFGNPPSTGYVQTAFGASVGIPPVNGDPTHNFFFTPGTNGVSAAYSVVETLGVGGQIETIACQGCGATEIGAFLTFLGASGTTNRSGFIAEPINTAIGNYFSTHVDLSVPGRGLSFTFTRSYNSRDPYSGPLGFGWTHSYNIFLTVDAGSGVVTIKEADGHQVSFNPSGGSYAPATKGLFDNLKKNVDGSFTLTRKNQTQLNFSSSGRLLTIVDRNGNTQTLSYVGINLTVITDSSGRIFHLSYDASNRLVTLVDPIGRAIHYAYDVSGNLISAQDALGGTTQYEYDTSHRMTAGTDPRGNIYMQNTYDTAGRVIQQKNARGFATTLVYNTPSAGVTTITDPLGNITKHVHDADLRLVQVFDALGGITASTYSTNNLKLLTTDPLGRTQNFAYDANGNLTGATDANGKTTQFAYNGTNDLLQVTDRLGRITHFNYDSKGNLLSVLDPAGNASGFTYDSAGQTTAAKNARNSTTSFAYDAAGNLSEVTDALGGTVQLTYDTVGRLLSVKNQLGNTSTPSYDANNRLVSVTDPLANTTQFVYDHNGNLIQLTDANGKGKRYSFDASNKLAQITDAIGGTTNYTYDGNTDLVSVTDANSHVTTYAYDSLRRLKTTADPLGRQKRYSYDGDGNTISVLDGNGKTNTFDYDTLNRLVSMALSDGKSVSYTYDAVGNRLNMTDWHGTTQYLSDALNRAISVTTPDGKTIGYAYDAAGNRVSLTYPTGKKVQNQFDALNRLAQVTDLGGNVTTYAYDAAGNLTAMNQPNRTFSTYGYDAANRLLQVTNLSKGQVLSSFGYTLDKVGNRLQITSSQGNVARYGYDDLYRLTSWIDPASHVTNYVYDAVGNRVSVAAPNGTISYAYDVANQMLTANSTSFAYDGNGSLIRKTVGGANTNYTWGALNWLIAVTGGGVNTQYGYDGDGNRVQQQVSAGTYQYLNDVVASLPAVLNEAGPDDTIDYARGLSLISESIQQKEYFYQFDGLGSVVTVTNEAGAHQANYGYDPWGQPATPNDPPIGLDALGTKNKYRFSGETADPNDDLVFLRARYYDPSIGRFISRDPLADITSGLPSNNPYAYAVSNPLRYTDPSGLSTFDSTPVTISSGGLCDQIDCISGVETIIDVAKVDARLGVKDVFTVPELAIGAFQDFTTVDPAHALGRLGVNSGLAAVFLATGPYGWAAGILYGTAQTLFPNQVNSIIDKTTNTLGNALATVLEPNIGPVNYTTPATLLDLSSH